MMQLTILYSLLLSITIIYYLCLPVFAQDCALHGLLYQIP